MTLKKLKFHLQLWDGVWSVPLGMALFIGFGVLLQRFFYNPADPEGAPGFYDPSFLQSMFYASAVQVFINLVVWLGIHFNFRRVKHYHSGTAKITYQTDSRPIADQEGCIENKSKQDFESLEPWQRLKLLLFLYCFLSVEYILVWVHLK